MNDENIKQLHGSQLFELMWAIDENTLVHANISSPFGKAIFQAISASVFTAMAFVSLACLNADAQVIDDLANRNLSVENVCLSAIHMKEEAIAQAISVRDTLYDFYAVFGKETCEQVLEVARQTANSTDGQVNSKAEF